MTSIEINRTLTQVGKIINNYCRILSQISNLSVENSQTTQHLMNSVNDENLSDCYDSHLKLSMLESVQQSYMAYSDGLFLQIAHLCNDDLTQIEVVSVEEGSQLDNESCKQENQHDSESSGYGSDTDSINRMKTSDIITTDSALYSSNGSFTSCETSDCYDESQVLSSA